MGNSKRIFTVLLLPGGGRELSLKRLYEAQNKGLHYDADMMLFTGGGLLSEEDNSGMKESDLMLQTYRRPAYKPEQIVMGESVSKNTFENIKYSLLRLQDFVHEEHIYQSYDEIRVIIASDADHLKRFQLSWNQIFLKMWTTQMDLHPRFEPLFGMRSIKDRLMEWFIFRPMHWYAPTGERWPVNWLIDWQRQQRSVYSVSWMIIYQHGYIVHAFSIGFQWNPLQLSSKSLYIYLLLQQLYKSISLREVTQW